MTAESGISGEFAAITKMIYKVRIVQCALEKHLEMPLSDDAGVLTDWYEGRELSESARAEFDRVLRTLCRRPLRDWDRPLYGQMSEAREAFGEIRFKADSREYRVFGTPVPPEYRRKRDVEEFAMVVGSYKKMKIYTPRHVLKTAAARVREIRTGRGTLRDYTTHLEI